MNKKIFTLLLICIATISVASVCAVELTKTNDFDGNFKMNITSSDAVKVLNDSLQDSANGGNTYQSKSAWTVNDNVSVFYYDGAMDSIVSTLKSNTGFTDDPTTDGDLTIFTNPEDADYSFKYLVGVSSGDKTVFVGCDNLDTAKEYANTITF